MQVSSHQKTGGAGASPSIRAFAERRCNFSLESFPQPTKRDKNHSREVKLERIRRTLVRSVASSSSWRERERERLAQTHPQQLQSATNKSDNSHKAANNAENLLGMPPPPLPFPCPNNTRKKFLLLRASS